nr:histidine--tRNA ligase, chloroplastic/mitochondrial-like isoform X1 [Ipomoea batatas]GMD14660.1 histidine--tRNA ligase, chloroplastic/mitochondrial-like isoform X1 [Ipomoea batatas]
MPPASYVLSSSAARSLKAEAMPTIFIPSHLIYRHHPPILKPCRWWMCSRAESPAQLRRAWIVSLCCCKNVSAFPPVSLH